MPRSRLLVLISFLSICAPAFSQDAGAPAAPALGGALGGALAPGSTAPLVPPGALNTSLDPGASILTPDNGLFQNQSPEAELPAKVPADILAEEPAKPEEREKKLLASEAIVTAIAPPGLPMFGMDFFARPALMVTQPSFVPVPQDYVLGPDDTFVVHVWNSLRDISYPLKVDREGKVKVPALGELFVWGQRLDQLETLFKREMNRLFTDAQVTVTLVTLRGISVYVVGEVLRPGLHVVSGLSTILTALHAAGGPTPRGTLRKILVKRNPEVSFDLYEFLLKGAQRRDVRLKDGDVILVGLRGPEAAVAGMVRRPARYELLGPTTLTQLLDLAGGIRAEGYRKLVQRQRPTDNVNRAIADLRLPEDASAPVQDGDAYRINAIFDRFENFVTLEGNVERPGTYQYTSGMRLTDLLALGRRLLAKTYLQRADLLRISGDPSQVHDPTPSQLRTLDTELISVDLTQALSGPADLLLRPGDRLVVYNRETLLPPLTVRVSGEVRKEGSYRLTSGLRVSDLLSLAGGLKRSAYELTAELGRVESADPFRTSIHTLNLSKALASDPLHDLPLQPDDRLFIKTLPDYNLNRTVTVSGEFRYPGTYLFNPGDRLDSIILRAGGFTDRAYLPAAQFIRKSVKEAQEKRLDEFRRDERRRILKVTRDVSTSVGYAEPADKLAQVQALDGNKQLTESTDLMPANGRLIMHLIADLPAFSTSEYNLALEPGDTLHLPPAPAEITVVGEVTQSGSVLFEPNRTVDFYLSKVGGTTRDADRSRLSLLRADGSVISSQSSSRTPYWIWSGTRWTQSGSRSLSSIPVQRGDVLLVPGRYAIHRNRSKETIDAVFKSAVSVGALGGLFR